MAKKERKYYVFLAIILLLIVLVEIGKKDPIDWRFTLQEKDKIPYGTRVIYKTIPDLFPNKKITINDKSAWEYAQSHNYTGKNFIYISDVFNADKLETETILKNAEKGNVVFIAAHRFGFDFSDTLKFSVGYSSVFDSISKLNFYNRKLRRLHPYRFKKSAGFTSFSGFDTLKTEILAFDDGNNPVFIRQPYGKGFFYLSTVPEVFTNYAAVTEKNYEFAYKMLSYLPIKDVVWDEFYKPFRKEDKNSISYILSDKSLRTAWYILFITALFFVVFTAKRRQRIIPIIMPHKNKSLEFVRTISGLYFNSKNHKDIARKQFIYLNNFLKTKYNINLADKELLNIEKAALKTGTEEDLLKKLMRYYSKIMKPGKFYEQDLINFNKLIEKIYEICKR